MEGKGIYPGTTLQPEMGLDRNSDASAAGKAEKEKKLKKACADFDSYFIYFMLKTMRSTVPKSGLLGNVNGKDTYEMMMDQKVSDELAKRGGIGVQKMLFDQLKKGQI
ncbi:MAG: rod-binding protein [Syntrophales bacterium LBB04]|nr:rod-binding protein [Syntrophales bacterium LBB04]